MLEKVALWIGGRVSKRLARRAFERNYLDAVVRSNQFCPIRGIRAKAPCDIQLKDVYVPLRLTFTGAREIPPMEKPVPEESREYERFVRERERGETQDVPAALRRHGRLVVLGDPGSGKTTLVQYLAMLFACRQTEDMLGLHEDRLPLVVRLRDLKPANSGADYPTLIEFLKKECASRTLEAPPEFFERMLREGKCVVLLDGLDEVADEAERVRAAEWVERMVDSFPENRYLVTSRILGYRTAPLGRGFAQSTLKNFSRDDMKEFIRKWYPAVEIATKGDIPEAHKEADENSAHLIATIERNDRVAALAVNPLLLSIIALVHRSGAALPNRRVNLYNECTNVLLEYWDVGKGIPAKLDSDQKRRILAPIALKFHEDGGRDAPRRLVEAFLADGLRKIGRDATLAPEFLDNIQERSGILEERGVDRWGFTHLTFQEYLAAVELRDNPDADEILVARRFDPWWREVTLLYAGLKDPSSLIRRLLSEREDIFYSSLLLAGSCIADAASVADTELREKVVRRIEELYWEGVNGVVQEEALQALAYLRDTSVEERMIEKSKSKAPDVRWSAADALGKIGGEKAMESLVPLLKDEHSIVRRSAAYALAKIGGEKAMESLVPLLKDEHSIVRRSAADALAKIGGEKAMESLIPLLKDEDSDVRGSAAYALAEIGGEKAMESLVPLLKDEAPHVRRNAAFALAEIGGEKAMESLVPLLKDESSDVRGSAAYALGEIGGEKAMESLVPLLKDESSDVRGSAALALAEIGGEKAMESLVPLLKDEAPHVRGSAAYALGEIGGEKAMESLVPLLKDEAPHVRGSAALALAEIGGEKAMELLMPLLKDESSDVRGSAAYALAKIGGEKAVESLIPLLEDEQSYVRWGAAYALRKICARNRLVICPDGTVERLP